MRIIAVSTYKYVSYIWTSGSLVSDISSLQIASVRRRLPVDMAMSIHLSMLWWLYWHGMYTGPQTECVLNEYFLRAEASRSEPEHNHQTCFVLSSYHGLAVQQSLVTIWFAWKLSQGRKVGSTLAIQTAVSPWTRLACLACSCGHSSGGLLWCARHTHRNAPPACPGAWPRSSYLTSQIKLKNHLNMRLILRVGYHVL